MAGSVTLPRDSNKPRDGKLVQSVEKDGRKVRRVKQEMHGRKAYGHRGVQHRLENVRL